MTSAHTTALTARRLVIIGASSPLGMSIANTALLGGAEILAVSRSTAIRPNARGRGVLCG